MPAYEEARFSVWLGEWIICGRSFSAGRTGQSPKGATPPPLGCAEDTQRASSLLQAGRRFAMRFAASKAASLQPPDETERAR
jgi:hypothetical protein